MDREVRPTKATRARASSRPTGLWGATPYLACDRIVLEPLRLFHAAEMTAVLAGTGLYKFTGGAPVTVSQLMRRYAMLVAGSRSHAEHWHNWVVSLRGSSTLIGTVQATVQPHTTDMAWTIGLPWQQQGYGTEAALGLRTWLVRAGARSLAASIHPDHTASQKIAAALDLRRSVQATRNRVEQGTDDGEEVWIGFPTPGPVP